MSLQTRLSDLITAIGHDMKRHYGVVTTTYPIGGNLIPTSAAMQYNLTAINANVAVQQFSDVANLIDGQRVSFRFKDAGVAKGISWSQTAYRAIGVTLPIITVVGKTVYVSGKWNAADSKFDMTTVAQEA